MARHKKSLTTSRHNKARTLADIENYLTSGQELKQRAQEEKLINRKLRPASKRTYANKLKMKFRPFENLTQNKR